MKNAMGTIEYAQKLGEVEKELMKVKKGAPKHRVTLSLFGILKGATFSAKEIRASQKALFRKAKR